MLKVVEFWLTSFSECSASHENICHFDSGSTRFFANSLSFITTLFELDFLPLRSSVDESSDELPLLLLLDPIAQALEHRVIPLESAGLNPATGASGYKSG